MDEEPQRAERPPGWSADPQPAPDARALLAEVAKGDEAAFDQLYEVIARPVFGLVRRLLRNAAQSEEVTQEVLVEVWRTATHYRPDKGSAMTWVLTLAHRRAVDRVRSEQSAADREAKVGSRSGARAFDEVSESVLGRLEQLQVRRCMSTLTELQRESVLLTYYRGYTYREAAELVGSPMATVKTRLRDGLIRLRDCLGVGS
ncbi:MULTISPECIES: ECF RNA polymerase sigma factor SigK [Prauserella salsuginis group]|uniref:ECF RNA polymerase sigma factor SigK n=1 Tax=Prauserella salsuginis TaxID=387889 RepID=A0ABW6G8V6_9PSEU|nr:MULTISPECIES: ECF RNA polymerase sigma factor SigK [Prauserella salsuginis group]MCR3722495.1 RNA polymerase sigma-70 factor, ECF subfamily [Prauserella flava]MCR3736937.1 RNA polymerase sigma-70 factor, ECF subfamily [Prauserella salsuginis]